MFRCMATYIRSLLICMMLWLLCAATASASLVNQPMTGATAAGWVIGGSAYLTASTGVDPNGSGWLRLTEPTNDQAGYGFLDSSFDITQGAVIQFDYATWGGTGADGYSIYLFDGSYDWSTFSVGASGGSLGYAQKSIAPIDPGLSGGYIGIGVDEFGNFSNPTEGRIGGTGPINNSVAVRGPYNHPSGAYYFLGGSPTLAQQLDFPGQMFRPGQSTIQYRKVVIYLTPVASPNYLRVDVYVQFGANQPLTQVVTALNVGRPVPASVKVGYGASTGGSTNYHEIRNLVIDPLPTDINLALTKSVSSPTVTQGGALTYTVTARNYGPKLTTATNVPITDSVPAQVTGVNWTCAGSNGGTCGAASGSGNNISTTATLPFNSAVTYTITGTVNAATPLGTVIDNTAALSAPAGITDYNPSDNSATATTTVTGPLVTVSGTVYNDNGTGGGTAHNGIRDGTEAGVNAGLTYYAKIFRSNDLTTTVVAPVQVSATTGAYSFASVPGYGTYTIILSTTNTANVYDPSFPAQWTWITPADYVVSNVTASGTNLTGENFLVYNGSRITGKVINDNGLNGSITTANDGNLNAAETGIAGVTVQLKNGGTVLATDTTDSGGTFTLFTNNVSANPLLITETNPAGYTSVSFNAGTTGGAYTIASDTISFSYTRYTNYSGVIFGDVALNTFTPATSTGSSSAPTPVYYGHTFTPASGGSVTFAAVRTQGSWPAVAYYRDVACNGVYDSGTDTAIAGAITASAGVPICILVKETIPAIATNGTIDAITTTATFTYTNSVGPVTSTYPVTDTTTVIASDLSTSTKSWVDLNGGDQIQNDVIQYTITLKETAGNAATGVQVTDNIDTTNYPGGLTVVSFPAGATNSSTATAINITNITVPANGTVTIVFNVTIGAAVAVGTTIDNTATVSNPGGPGDLASALTLTVAGSTLPGSGNKPLYLYDGTSSPAYKLSRTPMIVTPLSNVVIPRGNTIQSWILSPVLQSGVTISSGMINVQLWLSTNTARTYTIPITLRCGATAVASETTQTAALTTGAATQFNFTLNLAANYTCAAGNAWRLDVTNAQAAGGTARDIRVYPAPAANSFSQVILPSLNVINVNSIGLYSAAYPAAGTLTQVPSNSTVYIRATVSDPFGSYDISSAAITLTDSASTVRVTPPAAMTQVYDSVGLTKIYEYAYPVPWAGPEGNWLVQVTAKEGSEGTVADYGLVALPVVMLPLLTVTKTTNPVITSINPGQPVTYKSVITNNGYGTALSVVLTDSLSPYTAWGIDSFAPGVAFQFIDGPGYFDAASGLTLGTPVYSQDKGLTWTYPLSSGGGGAPAGYDANVTNWKIPMTGTMNGWTGGANPKPSFTINYKVLAR